MKNDKFPTLDPENFWIMMKKFLLVTILLGLSFVGGISYRFVKEKIRTARKEKLCRIAHTTHPVLGNKPFVIITLSYNNAPYVEKNLLSTLQQSYDNFRILYIDDASIDGTGEKVRQLIDLYDLKGRVTLIENDENKGAMHNLYHAVHSCKSDEIAVIVDGDDFLAHSNVLSKLNAYYANPDVWLTYGNFAEYPSYAKGADRKHADARPINLKILNERGIRHHAFVTTHLRTFYAGLFKRVKLQDFLDKGDFFPVGCDVASMLPMVELAGEHAYFIDDILYLYNTKNPNSDFKKDLKSQVAIEKKIRNMQAYAPLKEHPKQDFIHLDEYVDLAVFSYKRPLQLYAFLESCEKYTKNLHRTFVIYRSGNEHYEKGYQEVKKNFPDVIYFKQSDIAPYEDFAPLLRKAVFDSEMSIARYVIFAVDDIVVKDSIDFQEGVSKLKQTGAYGLYYRMGSRVDYCYMQDFYQGIPLSLSIDDELYAWQFASGKGDWRYPNTVDMALFRKEDLYPYFLCMKFHNPNILEALWNEHADLSKIGLYYKDSKVVNLPLNIVMENECVNERISNISTKDLLKLWEQGLKMDIEPLHHLDNHSVHIEYEPKFIKR